MKKYKKISSIICIIITILILISGCGKKETAMNNDKISTTVATPTDKNSSDTTPAEKVTPTNAVSVTPSVTSSTKKPDTTTKPTAIPSPTKQVSTVTPKAADGKVITIEGSGVSKNVSFTLNDLKSFKEGYVEDDYYSLNSYGTKKYFHFKGISVWYLLSKKAGIKSSAAKVTFTAEDGYSVEYSIADVKRDNYISEENPAKKYKMIIAWEENGKEYDPKEGSPFKLVVGQKEPGDVNKPNWVQNLKSIKVQ